MSPEELYRQERDRARAQGKRTLHRLGEVANLTKEEANTEQIKEAKRQLDLLSEQKTFRGKNAAHRAGNKTAG